MYSLVVFHARHKVRNPPLLAGKLRVNITFLSTEITFSVALHSGMHDCTFTICRHHSLRRCNCSEEIKQRLQRQQLRFCLYDYAAAVHNVQNDRCLLFKFVSVLILKGSSNCMDELEPVDIVVCQPDA